MPPGLADWWASSVDARPVNMAGIKRAVKGVCANGQAAGTMRAIMAELEKLGVVKTRTYTTIAEIKRH